MQFQVQKKNNEINRFKKNSIPFSGRSAGESGSSPGASGSSPGACVRMASELLKIKRNLDLFKLQYLDLHQVEEFQEAFSKGKTDNNYLFYAWLAMKLASKPNKKESVELVLHQYRPNLRPAKKKRGNNLPEGPNR